MLADYEAIVAWGQNSFVQSCHAPHRQRKKGHVHRLGQKMTLFVANMARHYAHVDSQDMPSSCECICLATLCHHKSNILSMLTEVDERLPCTESKHLQLSLHKHTRAPAPIQANATISTLTIESCNMCHLQVLACNRLRQCVTCSWNGRLHT